MLDFAWSSFVTYLALFKMKFCMSQPNLVQIFQIIGYTCWVLLNLYILNAVRCPYVRTYVRNGGRGKFNSEWRHNENDVIITTGAASAVGARRHNANAVTMTTVGLWTYGDCRHLCGHGLHRSRHFKNHSRRTCAQIKFKISQWALEAAYASSCHHSLW